MNVMGPLRCGVIVSSNPDDKGEVSVPCRRRVLKNGLCGIHESERVKVGEYRRLHITRHRIGYDETGKMVYGTREPRDEQHWCSRLSCRRPPIINLENVLYCEKDFMREQKRRQRIEAKKSA